MVFRVALTKPATFALQEEDFGVLILKLELQGVFQQILHQNQNDSITLRELDITFDN